MAPPEKNLPVILAGMPASIAVLVRSVPRQRHPRPVQLGILLSFLLSPVCDWLERWRLGGSRRCCDCHGGLHRAGAFWRGRQRSGRVTSLQNPRVQRQYRGEAQLCERVRSRRAEQNDPDKPGKCAAIFKLEQDSEPRGTDKLPFSFAWSPHRPPAGNLWWMFAHCLRSWDHRVSSLWFVVFFLIGREDLRDRFIHLAGKGEVTLTTKCWKTPARG